MFLNDFPSIMPIHSFDIAIDGKYVKKNEKNISKNNKYKLPTFNKYVKQKEKIDCYFGWNEDFLLINMEVLTENLEIDYPEFRRRNSVEIFIDTKNSSSVGHLTKFTHHLVVFPQKVNNFYIKEVTKFILDDAHQINDPSLFEIDMRESKKGYFFSLKIPSTCLYGFNGNETKEIGFTYRVNRKYIKSICFNSFDEEFNIERFPNLFAKINLTK